MKFVLGNSSSYWWPVTVRRPDPDAPGKIVELQLRVRLRPQDQEAFFDEQERIGQIPGRRAQAKAERAALAARIEDWDDVVGADGERVPCTPEALDQALQETAFRAGVWKAINESALGEEARLGN